MAERYQRPGWFTTHVFNPIVAGLTRVGLSVYGSRVLEVKGRKSGEWRQVPVNLLRHEGVDYLVAPRGQTQWVKNLRASGEARLRVGRRTQTFSALELTDDEKPPLLRAYLKKWKFEVGVFFEGVGPDSPEEELRRIAPGYPVFRLAAGASSASARAPSPRS
ncbi:MAG TPA: nitroreductase family deazaflavin-dependent oxidoreductase [Thermoleophilaceae bacterium]